MLNFACCHFTVISASTSTNVKEQQGGILVTANQKLLNLALWSTFCLMNHAVMAQSGEEASFQQVAAVLCRFAVQENEEFIWDALEFINVDQEGIERWERAFENPIALTGVAVLADMFGSDILSSLEEDAVDFGEFFTNDVFGLGENLTVDVDSISLPLWHMELEHAEISVKAKLYLDETNEPVGLMITVLYEF